MGNMDLNAKKWEDFYLVDLFPEIQRGKRLTKENQITGEIPYISSTVLNNGIDNFISNNSNIRMFSNCLSVANSGSVGSSFYHPYEFIASDHITHLKNENMNVYVYLFIATLIKRFSEKYNFNREINDKRISREKITLPVDDEGKPDYEYMKQYVSRIKEKKTDELKSFVQNKLQGLKYAETPGLTEKQWKEFCIDDIFIISAGKRLEKHNMIAGEIPFIGATDSGNGITNYVANKNESMDKNVLGVNYNGNGVAISFYHPYECLFTDDVKRFHLKNSNDNAYVFLFLKTTILQQKSKYNYGYKFNEKRMKRQYLLLPIDDEGNPDYDYMEQYAKNLMIKKYKQYLDYIEKEP